MRFQYPCCELSGYGRDESHKRKTGRVVLSKSEVVQYSTAVGHDTVQYHVVIV